MSPLDGRPLLGVADVARRLAVRESWVYAAAEAGTLPSVKIGRYLRFEPAAFEAWLATQRRGGGQ